MTPPPLPQVGPDSRVLIIGAGPTGLGAGYRLKELGHTNFTVVDRHPYIGGLAASFTDPAGFTWDIGGHVMFSHYEYYDRLFERVMGDEFSMIERETWVRADKHWVPYPFQNNIRYLSKEAAFECIAGLVKAQGGAGGAGGAAGAIAGAKNFAEFMNAAFGEGIVRFFMRPYNFKVWAHPAEMMAKDWIGQRVAVVDVQRALRNLVLGLDDFGWGPNNRFKFPLRGGTGEFYRRIGAQIAGHLKLGRGVARIDVDRRIATFANGTSESYDHVLSAMPVDVLVRDVLTGSVPSFVREAAARLRHSGGFMVGIGIRRPCPSTRSWMYFADDDCPFYRVTYLSNYSPFMTPDKDRYYSLLCEVSYSEFKQVDGSRVLEETIRGLENAGLLQPGERDDIVSTWVYDASYAYPTPTVDRDAALSEIIPWLESKGISSRGRFGMWKYEVANTDHSIMQGVEWANRVKLGEHETTIGIQYSAMDDGRMAARHDRAAVAGSGQPRIEVVARNRQGASA